MSSRPKNKVQRRALIYTLLFFFIGGGACVLVLLWASQAEHSEFAKSLRRSIGLPEPEASPVVSESSPAPVETPADPEPPVEPVEVDAPPVIPTITIEEICRMRQLWPRELELVLKKQVSIRYNDNTYGYMEFTPGLKLKVDALKPNGEVLCLADGNYLSLSVHETNFIAWFNSKYGERYDLQPILYQREIRRPSSRQRIGTPEGDAAFWADLRIWCNQNYDSIAIQMSNDNLVFRWLPREDAPVNYEVEARMIAREYLLKRFEYGGHENYAACEIRHPVTGELLGASSIFIPRL